MGKATDIKELFDRTRNLNQLNREQYQPDKIKTALKARLLLQKTERKSEKLMKPSLSRTALKSGNSSIVEL